MKNAIVIGAGIAGIAASIRLAVKGYQVEVYESNSYPGGKLSSLEQDGFRFDAGPSLFTMPHLVDELFQLAGKDPADYFQYRSLDNVCNYFFPDGIEIQGKGNPEEFSREIEDKLGVPAQVVMDYFARSEMKYLKTKGVFLERSLHKLSTYLKKDTLIGILNLYRLGIFKSLDQENERRLKHPKLVQLFNRYATYNGSNPYSTPGIMSMISHLEHGIGAALPIGGMHAITASLVKLGQDLGVKYHLGQGVERIVVKEGKAQGIQIGGKLVQADVVVSNVDVYPAYRKLMPDQKAPEKILKHERSSSALIYYWGIDPGKGKDGTRMIPVEAFAKLDLHNIFFSGDYKQEFQQIFEEGTVGDDPTVYVNITSKYEQDDAPGGMENWFVMVNVPCNAGQDWERLRRNTRRNVIDKLSQMLQVDLEQHIVTEDYLDPIRIEERTGSYRGALYGASSNDRMTAFFRHANFSRRIKDLFFCGGSVHPGGGIPLCLLSAKIVSDLVGPAVGPPPDLSKIAKERRMLVVE